MLTTDGTSQDQNWFHMALILFSFYRHSSEILTNETFQEWHVLTKTCINTHW